jgi:CubicO group peptidase (beta-lactamase class C family)
VEVIGGRATEDRRYARGVSGQRALPEQASLRHLKLEAKRRLAAGEFTSLHSAQLAVAREHGQPSWTALKNAVTEREQKEGRALAQLRWIADRFRDVAEDGWTPPGEEELREHFTDEFLAAVPRDRLIGTIRSVGSGLREEPEVVGGTRFAVQCRVTGHLVAAATETSPPYRLIGVQVRRLGERVSDLRTAAPATTAEGAVPDAVAEITVNAFRRLGLPGLSLAGCAVGEPGWAAATGWADLERDEPLSPGHRLPAYAITSVVTAVALLRLVADGRLGLDEPANRYLERVRLADDEVTVRQLLSHAGGVTDPATLFAPVAADLLALTGPVIECDGKRGSFQFSLTGYGALGEIIAGRAGQPYPEAVARLVLGPLSMTASWFPTGWPTPMAAGYPTVTGYDVTIEGAFEPIPGQVCAITAGGGLWTTAADLTRFGLGWRSLLPRSLSAQALRPHVLMPTGVQSGLGWIVNEPLGIAGHAGGGPNGAGSLITTLDGRRAHAALANRLIPVEEINATVLRAVGGLPDAAGRVHS